MRKKILVLSLLAVMIFTLAACSQTDVVGKQSAVSFGEVLKAIPDNVNADETNVGWSLAAPDDTVRFIWSEDYSKSPLNDVMLEMNAKPFVDAGLDSGKLPDTYAVYNDMLMVGVKLGNDKLSYNGNPTPLAAYEQIVSRYRSLVNYHTNLDHFGVKLGDGNMFEWAKDMNENGTTKENQDKDIVFVLNPEPLIAAGVDPEKVEGWVYAQVPVDEKGKTIQVWKFLKPFDIKQTK